MSSNSSLLMSGSRGSSRKRPAALSASSPLTGSSALVELEPPPARRARRDVLSCELETVQAELEHERSLRTLDSKRFVQTKQRLEQRCEFALEEAKEAKALMEEMREENERHLDQLKRAMTRTKAELREVQEDLDEERATSSRNQMEDDPRIDRLEDDLEAKAIENEQLKGTIDELRRELKQFIKDKKSEALGDEEEGSLGALSEARPEVLKELNRVRIRLAETERKNRQYKRIAEEAQRKTKQFLQEKEQARSSNKRIEQLEMELKDAVRAEESVSEKLRKWQGLGSIMLTAMGPGKVTGLDPSAPPDVGVLRQFLNDTQAKTKESEDHQTALKKELEKAGDTIQALEIEKASFGRKEVAWEEERREQEKRKELLQKDIKVLRGQEGIYKRELESLRSIVKTFDDLPLNASQGGRVAGESGPPSGNIRVLEVSLKAAREEIDVLKAAKHGLQEDLKSSTSEKEELQKKHSTVMEKFGKLRDALYAERAKAEKAVERANEAEILAGKGSFNPDHTRVLHMGTNPLTAALKEEIGVLRKQIEVLSNGDKKNKSSYASDVDPNKLHQRLKQSFKEQISRFREGVYLMTGYKVDMIPDNDCYKFKVRSVFAERERDHLVFQWPEGKAVTSLDLLNTEHAKLLTKTPSYEYMTKFHSLPAFMASVQLSLFENQTMIS